MNDKPLNGSDDKQVAFEIDPKKLGLQGRELLGELKAVSRWCALLLSMKDRSTDPQERVFLSEMAAALEDDGRRLSFVLAQFAAKRGAGKVHDADDDEPEAETK